MLTIKQVNKSIRELGGDEQLFKGDGYYYFGEGSTGDWSQTSVYVFRLNDLNLESWIEEWQKLRCELADDNRSSN